MEIEVWSDIACPFCYIGKRVLDKALAQFEYKSEVKVAFRSFQLNPDLETDPTLNPVQHLASLKGWSLDYTRGLQAKVVLMGHEVGLGMNFENGVVANTFDAHRLIQFAQSRGDSSRVVEALFEAYFCSGLNVADPEVLVALAIQAGLDKVEAEKVMRSDAFSDQVLEDCHRARHLGIRGVPFTLVAGKYAVSGAQPLEIFLSALQKSWAETRA
jgi:predicted DsbA family dithiol-disulfide isomerase